jgi:hypothetical protein
VYTARANAAVLTNLPALPANALLGLVGTRTRAALGDLLRILVVDELIFLHVW